MDGRTNRDAAWYYPQPSPAASMIAGHVAFWRGVRVERVPGAGAVTPEAAGTGRTRRILARLYRTGARA